MEISRNNQGRNAQVSYSRTMIYRFDQFELDMARFELHEDAAVQLRELVAHRPALCCKLGNNRPGNLLKNIG
jgi:hypothetical protein